MAAVGSTTQSTRAAELRQSHAQSELRRAERNRDAADQAMQRAQDLSRRAEQTAQAETPPADAEDPGLVDAYA